MRGGPPPEVIAELIALLQRFGDDPDAGRRDPPGRQQLRGTPGAVSRAPLRIAGRVSGPIAVANGTLHLLRGADVEGDILVVGGRLIRPPGRATRAASGCSGTRPRSARPRRHAWCSGSGDDRSASWPPRGPRFRRGRSEPPCSSPPVAPTTGSKGCRSYSARCSSCARRRAPRCGSIYAGSCGPRAKANRLSSDFGYLVRGASTGRRRFGITGRLYSELAPIEDQPLSLSESGWSAFLLQRDYRDYFERRGGGGWPWVQPRPAAPIRALGPAATTERSVRATDPWSLFRNSDQWRRNPLIDDGHYFTTGLQLDFDTRNDRDHPSTGWLIRTRFEHSTSDDVAPVALPEEVRPAIPLGAATASTGSPSTSGATPGSPRRCGSTPGSGQRGGSTATGFRCSAGSRSGARPAAGLRLPRHSPARRAGSAILPTPALCDRVDQRPGRGAHPARAQPRLPDARPRGQPHRPVHRHRGGRSGPARRCGQGVARRRWPGPGPGEPHPHVRRVGCGSRRGARRRGDRSLPRQGPLGEGGPVKFVVRLQRRF